MKKRTKRLLAGAVGPLAVTAAVAGTAAAVDSIGPNAGVSPYVTSVGFSGVDVKSLLTVQSTDPSNANTSAAANGYKMVGIPDGLGARLDGNGKVEVFMNQEIGATLGTVRAHGQKGAFVARYTIDPVTHAVLSGSDLMTSVQYFNYDTATYGAAPGGSIAATSAAFARFCSGNLGTAKHLFNAASGNGYNGDLYFTGEENGTEGRFLAIDPATGVAYQLPKLGLFSWENGLPNLATSDKTIVTGNDDSTNGPLWMYEGTKTNAGLAIDKAGLTNGKEYGLKLAGTATEALFRTNFGKNNPQVVTFEEVNWNQSGANQRTEALTTDGDLQFNRIEDGAWDPTDPNVFWFVTTGGNSGLWKLTLTSTVTGLSAGGTLTLVLDGTEIPSNDTIDLKTLDNLDVDSAGRVIMQEDPGNDAHVARIIAFRPSDTALRTVAKFDPSRYPTTNDEESSGIIDTAKQFGPNTYLFDAQIHSATNLTNATEAVEHGQLMLMTVNWPQVFGDPEPVVPEAPVVVLMGLSALAVAGGGVLLMKRRNGLTVA